MAFVSVHDMHWQYQPCTLLLVVYAARSQRIRGVSRFATGRHIRLEGLPQCRSGEHRRGGRGTQDREVLELRIFGIVSMRLHPSSRRTIVSTNTCYVADYILIGAVMRRVTATSYCRKGSNSSYSIRSALSHQPNGR